jgi:hypothetical protein
MLFTFSLRAFKISKRASLFLDLFPHSPPGSYFNSGNNQSWAQHHENLIVFFSKFPTELLSRFLQMWMDSLLYHSQICSRTDFGNKKPTLILFITLNFLCWAFITQFVVQRSLILEIQNIANHFYLSPAMLIAQYGNPGWITHRI